MEPTWERLVSRPPSRLNIRWARDAEIDARVFGAISRPETINYRTYRPEQDGLFDEATFGSLTSPDAEDDREAQVEHPGSKGAVSRPTYCWIRCWWSPLHVVR